MKVLHIASSLHGGAGKAAYRIHEAERAIGLDSEIITLSAPQSLFHNPRVHQVHRKLTTRVSSIFKTKFQARLVQNSPNLMTPISINLINSDSELVKNADVLHIHNFYNLINLPALPELAKNKKVVVTLHDQRFFTGGCHYTLECQNFIERDCRLCPQVRTWSRHLVERSFMSGSIAVKHLRKLHIASPSIWLKEQAMKSFILKNAKHHMIRNPASPAFLQTPTPHKSDSKKSFAFVSLNLDNPYKGIEVLTSALKEIHNQEWFQNVEILLVGNGPIPKFPRGAQIRQVKVDKDSDLKAILEKVDAVIIPSKQDNFPNVISESLLSGCDLVTSDAGGVSELAQEVGHHVFPSGNSASLARILENYQPDHSKRATRIEYAKAVFSPDAIASAYYDVYRSTNS